MRKIGGPPAPMGWSPGGGRPECFNWCIDCGYHSDMGNCTSGFGYNACKDGPMHKVKVAVKDNKYFDAHLVKIKFEDDCIDLVEKEIEK